MMARKNLAFLLVALVVLFCYVVFVCRYDIVESDEFRIGEKESKIVDVQAKPKQTKSPDVEDYADVQSKPEQTKSPDVDKESEIADVQTKPEQTKSPDVEDYWWQPYVDVVSRRYEASDDTEWCQDMEGDFSWSDSWNRDAYLSTAESELEFISELKVHKNLEAEQP